MSNEIQQFTPFDGYGNNEMVEYQPTPGRGAPAQASEATPAQQGMVRKVHNSLRGKYIIGMALGVVLGGLGGYFGFKSQQPIYRGEGLLQIAFNRSVVMTQSPDSGPMMNFEEYVQSQAMMMTSRKIIELAMGSPDWKPTSLGTDLKVQNAIAANLTVEHPSRTELIKVYYTDKDPGVAGSVVKSVVLAYYNYANNRNRQDDDKRLRLLDDRKSLLIGQIARLDNQIVDAANKYGTPDLGSYVEAKMQEESKIESMLHDAELALATVRQQGDKGAIGKFTENQIAMMDQTMRGLVAERDAMNSQIAGMTAAGIGKENIKMKQYLTLLDIQQKRVDKYAVEWRDLQVKLAEDPSLGQTGLQRVTPFSEKVLAAREASLKQKFTEIKQERTEIGRHMLRLQELQRIREEAEKDKGDVQRRIDMLVLESGMAGRLTVIQPGDVPIAPFKDRRKMFGAAGALGGFGLPLGILAFMGLMNKRYRFSDEANEGVGNVPLLGILPRLPDKLSDPEQAAVAAHCIHQIRIMLQVGANPDRRRVFMVTSASTGDGKTSLTMALGLSFAASGSKTLVIDCDMIGQGLTHRLKADNVPGLIETLNLGTLRGHVRKTASKGLYVLPIGSAESAHAGVLSPQSIKRLMAACREHFDVVVIDTGPILGSLEASVVATETDGVIMAVARGQQHPLVDKAIKHLRAIGANIFGIVFNRAEQRDFQRSVASASIRSQSAKPNEPRALLPESDESARFGPLARSVASYLPASASNNNGDRSGGSNGHHGDSPT